MLVRRIARPLLASMFVSGGIDQLRDPAGKASVAEPVTDRIAAATRPAAQKAAGQASDAVDATADATVDATTKVAAKVHDASGSVDEVDVPVEKVAEIADAMSERAEEATATISDAARRTSTAVHQVAAGQPLPFETETYVKVNGAVQVGAGILLATGKLPRLSSVALAATLIPTTLAAHRFWELEGEERKAQQVHFMKNAGLLGGLILAAVDTEGRPDLIHQARRVRKEAKVAGKAAAANASVGRKLIKANAKAAKRLAATNASDAGEMSRRKANQFAKAAKKEAMAYGKVARKEGKALANEARSVTKEARRRAEPYAKVAAARMG